MRNRWKYYTIAPEQTHHPLYGYPAYTTRFKEVLKFHVPGLAPVLTETAAYHIKSDGRAAYKRRFVRTFGFYELRAAAQTHEGWQHILTDGTPLYQEYYAWCGNFQEGYCTVRQFDTTYRHIWLDGTRAYNACYRYAGDFRDGIAVVQREDGLHTHIQGEGQLVHGHWFLNLDVFHKGYARARDEAGWFHIDKVGRPLYHRRFAAIEPFYNGQARVEEHSGALLIIDETARTLVHLRS